MFDIEDVRLDVAAFADDEDEVVIERDGTLVYQRNGATESAVISSDENDVLSVVVNDARLSYRKFLTHHLAGLPLLATRLLDKRPPPTPFVEPDAELQTTDNEREKRPALEALALQCSDTAPFASRVLFITADAGAGKTALLRTYQHKSARAFLDGKSKFLFWHVDLQGRQLLRLSEALMGDLGDLRVAGIYVPGIVRLLRQRALVLGIDGFDELAAEQGSTDALGALALMVSEMQDKGCLVAASRRSFFDTDDYLKRSNLVRRHGAASTEFHELRLQSWSRPQVIDYLAQAEDAESGRRFSDATDVYQSILSELNGQADHPMLTRPFLVTQLARALLRYDVEPADFIRGMGDPLKGVAELVHQFVQREVSDKWKSKETGEPYLSVDQHLQLLTTVAEEMHRSETDRVDTDVLDTIVAILLEEWSLPSQRRSQVAEMARMHVLLPPPLAGDFAARTFDHPEFREYFVARALASLLQTGSMDGLRNFLNVSTLSDSLARYVRTLLDADADAMQLVLDRLQQLVSDEWRPTNVQQNVGTLLAPLLDRSGNTASLTFRGQVVISSIALEGSHLQKVTLEQVNFLNASLLGVNWKDVKLLNCKVSELSIDEHSSFENVVLELCEVGGVRVLSGEEEIAREYDPRRIANLLVGLGIEIRNGDPALPLDLEDVGTESEARRVLQKLLAVFRRTTTMTADRVALKLRGADRALAVDVLLPLMEECGLVTAVPWRGQGQGRAVWALKYRVDQILEAEFSEASGPLAAFWPRLRELV